MKIFIVSLGCQKNLADMEEMCGNLTAVGHEIVFNEEEADAALINTCAFLQSAREESENEINRLLSLKKQGKLKKVVAAGCLVQKDGTSLLEKFPELDSMLDIHSVRKSPIAFKKKGFIKTKPYKFHLPALDKAPLTAHHTMYLKIADGCDNHCAYCLIPSIRGRYRSKTIHSVYFEARALTELHTVKEMSIIAQDTTRYGEDLRRAGITVPDELKKYMTTYPHLYATPTLENLLKSLLRLRSIRWWRIMYAYPERISDGLIAMMRDNEAICHYLDMPLQHISDKVLGRMARISTEKTICGIIEKLRKAMPDFAIRTNFIVGFPGETEEDFKKLLKFIREYELDNVGVFTFSREPGTRAYDMPDQIPEELKEERKAMLLEEQENVLKRKNRKLIGKEITVLVDNPLSGRTYADAPDIDGVVLLRKPVPDKVGTFIRAKIVGAKGYERLAEPL